MNHEEAARLLTEWVETATVEAALERLAATVGECDVELLYRWDVPHSGWFVGLAWWEDGPQDEAPQRRQFTGEAATLLAALAEAVLAAGLVMDGGGEAR